MAILLVLSGIAAGAISYVAADRLVHPPREHDPATPADRGLAYHDAVFTAADGIRLAGWWIPAPHAAGTVIFLHGYGASKSQALSVAPFLHAAGYNVLAFDFRGHGDSTGDHTTIGIEETKDVRAAVAYVEAETSAFEPIALFGWSMGAATALNAADSLPEVRAVIVDSAFARLANVVSHELNVFTGLPRYPFEPLIMTIASRMAGHGADEDQPALHAELLRRPLLVIQGTEDRIADPHADAQTLADSAGAYAQIWIVPGAGHVDARSVEPREYETHVLSFLRAAMS